MYKNVMQVTLALSVVMSSNINKLLVISVVNDKNQGVYSKIFAKTQTGEFIVGTTGHDGKMTDTNYHCTNDRNLIARPVDETYFNSSIEPCESPQSFLVISRITSAGYIAFNNFSEYLLADGSRYSVNVRSTIAKTEATGKDENANDTCRLDYDIGTEQSIYKENNSAWQSVIYNNIKPNPKIVVIDPSESVNSKIDWGKTKLTIENSSAGIKVFIPTKCKDITIQADQLSHLIAATYSDKIKDGKIDYDAIGYNAIRKANH